MNTTRLHNMRTPHWLGFYAGLLAAWLLLFFMAASTETTAFTDVYGAEFWRTLCTISPDVFGFFRLIMMWALMSAAMMAPTFVPSLVTWDDLPTTGPGDLWHLLMGYLLVWLGFSVLAAGLQFGLLLVGAVTPLGQSLSAPLSATLLILAGLYQFSRLKDACLSKCRMPLTFFMERWAPGQAAARGMGIRLGLLCLGCCWALMLLGFVGGVMNLAWMGAATVFMTLEKLPDLGRALTAPLGIALIIAGFWLLGTTLV